MRDDVTCAWKIFAEEFEVIVSLFCASRNSKLIAVPQVHSHVVCIYRAVLVIVYWASLHTLFGIFAN